MTIYNFFLFILTYVPISFEAKNIKTSTKNKEITEKIDKDKNTPEYYIKMMDAVKTKLEKELPTTINDFEDKFLKSENFGNFQVNEQIANLKKSLEIVKNKILKNKVFMELDACKKHKSSKICFFIILKCIYKTVVAGLLFPEILRSFDFDKKSYQDNNKDPQQIIINKLYKRLEKAIKDLENAEKNKKKVPNDLKKIITESKKILKNAPIKEINSHYDLILIVSYFISELECELKYLDVTNYITNQKAQELFA